MSYQRITPEDSVLLFNLSQNADNTQLYNYAYRLWELENQIAKGDLLKLPCKPSDTVYYVTEVDDGENIYNTILQGVVDCFNIEAGCKEVLVRYDGGLTYWHNFVDFGKEVFADKAEAEQKLKELQNKE